MTNDSDAHTRGLDRIEWVDAIFDRCASPDGYALTPGQFSNFDEWRAALRDRFDELLHIRRPHAPPRISTIRQVAFPGYARRDVIIDVTPKWRIPVWLLIPSAGEPPYPGIVCLHDWGGYMYHGRAKLVELADEPAPLRKHKDSAYAGRSIASDLARSGYAVIVTDALGFGERRLTTERIRQIEAETDSLDELIPKLQGLHREQREYGSWSVVNAAGGTWPGLLFDDDLHSLDWFAAQPEVDASRLGCVGLSVGAWRAAHLAALDERIRAAVVVGWMNSYESMVRGRQSGVGTAHLIYGLTKYADFPHVAAMAAPRAMLSIQGIRDPLFPTEGVEIAWKILRDAYTRAGSPDAFASSWHDDVHCFNAKMQKEAWAWLARWLNN